MEIDEELRDFILRQKIFFVGTAACNGRVNISPNGMDTLRVIGKSRIVWLNLTGSGNETAAHLLENDRITLIFCSFERNPMRNHLIDFNAIDWEYASNDTWQHHSTRQDQRDHDQHPI
ncbi:MAG TPA: pyridoxamine 5'-phosphate oxidase family protein [Candidatus Brocadiales bacterium]|nr:pyridoxamine 5'-phosphate oxidase family protein [Candidatus Brocadiales bacterium]